MSETVEYLTKLESLMEATGLDNEMEAADYVLLHYNAFTPDFVDFCERYVKGEYSNGF